jgi:hypothetical protein
VAFEDMDKLKKESIAKLERMNDLKFQQRYLKVYPALKDLPDAVKKKYAIQEDMSRQEAISQLKKLNKQMAYEVIDRLPDSAIAGQFRRYLLRHAQELEKRNLLEQINIFWSRITQRKQNLSSLLLPGKSPA